MNISNNLNSAVFISFEDALGFVEENYKQKIFKENYQKLESNLLEKKQIDPFTQKESKLLSVFREISAQSLFLRSY